jgi:biopolymer transport protein ExbD
MASRLRKKRNEQAVGVPVTSMGDIAFLLIIFFVIVGKFAQKEVPVNKPKSPDIATLEPAPFAVDKSEIYFYGSTADPIMVSDPEGLEWAVRAELSKRGIDEEDKSEVAQKARTVAVRIDRSIPRSLYIPIQEHVAKGGGRIALEGTDEK